MRHDTIDWPFQDPIHENQAALQRIPTFCKRFQRRWQSTTLAGEPRVSDTPTILEPLWDYSMNLAATQPVDCKKKLCYINPGPNASALSLIHLIVLPSIIVTYPGCSQSHPRQQLNRFFSPAADHRGWFPNHWEPTDLSNE